MLAGAGVAAGAVGVGVYAGVQRQRRQRRAGEAGTGSSTVAADTLSASGGWVLDGTAIHMATASVSGLKDEYDANNLFNVLDTIGIDVVFLFGVVDPVVNGGAPFTIPEVAARFKHVHYHKKENCNVYIRDGSEWGVVPGSFQLSSEKERDLSTVYYAKLKIAHQQTGKTLKTFMVSLVGGKNDDKVLFKHPVETMNSIKTGVLKDQLSEEYDVVCVDMNTYSGVWAKSEDVESTKKKIRDNVGSGVAYFDSKFIQYHIHPFKFLQDHGYDSNLLPEDNPDYVGNTYVIATREGGLVKQRAGVSSLVSESYPVLLTMHAVIDKSGGFGYVGTEKNNE